MLRDGPEGHRVLIIHGSLNNSRISISENILNQAEVERAEGNQRKTRGVCPFQPWPVNNLDRLWGTKSPELRIFSNQMFSNRCQTHSIEHVCAQFLLVPCGLSKLSSMSLLGKNVIWATTSIKGVVGMKVCTNGVLCAPLVPGFGA